jgi:hypothetical protein
MMCVSSENDRRQKQVKKDVFMLGKKEMAANDIYWWSMQSQKIGKPKLKGVILVCLTQLPTHPLLFTFAKQLPQKMRGRV